MLSGNTIPGPILWKDETISAPARAPNRKLIHIGASTWMATPVNVSLSLVRESALRKNAEAFCISVVTIPVIGWTLIPPNILQASF
jgi:hypothetical protein